MGNILNYGDFVNELFGFGKSKYDDIAKSNFNKLLDNLDKVQVQKYADYKREVIIDLKKDETKSESEVNNKEKVPPVSGESERENSKVEERKVIGLKKQGGEYTPPKSIHDVIKKPDYTNQTKIEVMKNYSKHRLSSKIFGKGDQNTYSLAINGKHFVSDVRGEEGKSLVSDNISKLFWNLLSELSTIQEDFRKKLIDENEYKKKISDIKTKYSSKIK